MAYKLSTYTAQSGLKEENDAIQHNVSDGRAIANTLQICGTLLLCRLNCWNSIKPGLYEPQLPVERDNTLTLITLLKNSSQLDDDDEDVRGD